MKSQPITTPTLTGRIAGRELAWSQGLKTVAISRRGGSGGRGELIGIHPDRVQAGRGVQISGNEVIVQPPPAQAEFVKPADTRVIRLWGKIAGTFDGESFASPDWVAAAIVLRADGSIGVDGDFWEGTQLLNLTREGGDRLVREFTLTLEARRHQPDRGPWYPDPLSVRIQESNLRAFGAPVGPYRLTLSEIVRQAGRDEEEVRQHVLILPANGAVSKAFRPQQPELFTELQPLSITRF